MVLSWIKVISQSSVFIVRHCWLFQRFEEVIFLTFDFYQRFIQNVDSAGNVDNVQMQHLFFKNKNLFTKITAKISTRIKFMELIFESKELELNFILIFYGSLFIPTN